MSTATLEKHSIKSLEAAKASLREQFDAFINRAPESTVMRAATLTGDNALIAVLAKPAKPLSIEARNQIAINQMKVRAFETFKSACSFLEAAVVCEILDVSKQALSKKSKLGYVIAYSHNHRKLFPEFQFTKNKENPAIARLIKAAGIDPTDETQVNLLVAFLVQPMDFSNAGDNENVVPRYTLIDNEDAFPVLVRDFKNRLEMGQ